MLIKTFISDKSDNSIEILKTKLKNSEGFEVAGCFDNLNSIRSCDIDLIIFDINSNEADSILEKIKELKSKNKNIAFIATSYEINSELVTKTLSAGVSDFILKPFIDSILNVSLKKIQDLKENKSKIFSNTICIFSNKGGVGKTSIAVNSAFELSKIADNEKVCILDLNFNSSDVSTFLNIEPKNNINYILNALENSNNELILSMMDRYNDSNLYIFSFENQEEDASKLSLQTIYKIINCLKNIFRWVVIDMSGAINETNVAILNSCDLILTICLMNMISIRNTQKTLELFKNAGFSENKIKLIINRYIQNSEISIDDIEKTIGKNISAKIPNNYLTLIDAINIGQPIGEINPQSNIARAYKNLSQEIANLDFLSLNETSKNNYNHGIFNLLRRMGE